MTEYVRIAFPEFKKYWESYGGSEIIPVKPGGPKLAWYNKLLRRKKKAYYEIDVDAMPPDEKNHMIEEISRALGVSWQEAERRLRDYHLRAGLVVKISEEEAERSLCPVCRRPVREGAIYCAHCGTKLKQEMVVQPRVPQLVYEEPSPSAAPALVEDYNQSVGNIAQLEQVQVTQLQVPRLTTNELVNMANEFIFVWDQVLEFLEFLHSKFCLHSITFKRVRKRKENIYAVKAVGSFRGIQKRVKNSSNNTNKSNFPMMVGENNIMEKAMSFNTTYGKVMTLLEFMHDKFGLEKIIFKNGSAIPIFNNTSQKKNVKPRNKKPQQ
jgi:hypothetical protein